MYYYYLLTTLSI